MRGRRERVALLFEEAVFGGVIRECERLVIGRARLVVAVEAAEKFGSRCVEEVVLVEVERVDDCEGGCGLAIMPWTAPSMR